MKTLILIGPVGYPRGTRGPEGRPQNRQKPESIPGSDKRECKYREDEAVAHNCEASDLPGQQYDH